MNATIMLPDILQWHYSHSQVIIQVITAVFADGLVPISVRPYAITLITQGNRCISVSPQRNEHFPCEARIMSNKLKSNYLMTRSIIYHSTISYISQQYQVRDVNTHERQAMECPLWAFFKRKCSFVSTKPVDGLAVPFRCDAIKRHCQSKFEVFIYCCIPSGCN